MLDHLLVMALVPKETFLGLPYKLLKNKKTDGTGTVEFITVYFYIIGSSKKLVYLH